jgi:FkbM family methyltransferase
MKLSLLRFIVSHFRLLELARKLRTANHFSGSIKPNRAYPSSKQLDVLSFFPPHLLTRLFEDFSAIEIFAASRSQVGQDLLALLVSFAADETATSQEKTKFFVEFGACDGLVYSNTWILEKYFGWSGILAEPGRTFHAKLAANRPQSKISYDAVDETTGLAKTFSENVETPSLSQLSAHTVDNINSNSMGNRNYQVSTISLKDLLIKFDAPSKIQYLSIDIEGNELPVLMGLDFENYTFDVITIEVANRTENQDTISFLESKGYIYLEPLADVSGADAWFIHQDLRLGSLSSLVEANWT